MPATSSSSTRSYLLLLAGTLAVVAAGSWFFLAGGGESATEVDTTVVSGVAAPTALPTSTPIVPTAVPEAAVGAATPLPTALPIIAPPTVTPTPEEVPPTTTPTAAPTATPAPATSTPAPATATPETAAETETSATDSADTGDTGNTGEPATAVAEAVPTATPQPATAPAPVATQAPAQTELPAFSSGGSFTYALKALPTTSKARIFDQPGGQELQVTYDFLDGSTVLNDLINPTHYGNALSLRVVRGEPGDPWALVELPTRPAGQTGWVDTSPYEWTSSNYMVRINVTTNSVTIWNGSDIVLETDAVTGSANTPTPVLNGYVDEKIYGLGGAYGPVLLSLGVFSNSLNTFGSNGEVPKIALHGTNRPELMGQYASNGCIRVRNEIIRQIADLVPVGSRVEIVR